VNNLTKERTNLYLNKRLKQEAQEKLEAYGMNLSTFVNLMLAKFLQRDVDMLLPPEIQEVWDGVESRKRGRKV
jgi:antitoxin component of RelBE/YafQ-DinJ toxin-antitoxin module